MVTAGILLRPMEWMRVVGLISGSVELVVGIPLAYATAVSLGRFSLFAIAPIVSFIARQRDLRDFLGYDIGVAISIDRGLVVPIVRDADKLHFAEIEGAVADLAPITGMVASADLLPGEQLVRRHDKSTTTGLGHGSKQFFPSGIVAHLDGINAYGITVLLFEGGSLIGRCHAHVLAVAHNDEGGFSLQPFQVADSRRNCCWTCRAWAIWCSRVESLTAGLTAM